MQIDFILTGQDFSCVFYISINKYHYQKESEIFQV